MHKCIKFHTYILKVIAIFLKKNEKKVTEYKKKILNQNRNNLNKMQNFNERKNNLSNITIA